MLANNSVAVYGESSAAASLAETRAMQEEISVSGRNKGIRAIDLTRVFSSPQDAKLLLLVTRLDLSRNEIESVEELRAMSSLHTLDISYNHVSSIVGLPGTLVSLNVSHNRLLSLDGVKALCHLQNLDVQGNRLTCLTGLQPDMPLHTLYADDNRLISIKEVYNLRELHALTLANNFINNVEELCVLSSTPRLQILCLEHNPIVATPGLATFICRLVPALLMLDHKPAPQLAQHEAMHISETVEQEVRKIDRTNLQASSIRVLSALDQQALKTTPLARRERQQLHDCAAGKTLCSADTISTASEYMTPIAKREPPQPAPSRSSCTATAGVQSRSRLSDDSGGGESDRRDSQLSRRVHVLHAQHTACDRAPCDNGDQDATSDSKERETRTVAFGAGYYTARHSRVSQRDTATSYLHTNYADAPPPTIGNSTTDSKTAQTALLYNALTSKEHLEKENRTLLARLRKIETELQNARGVISTQLHKLAEMRLECDAFRHNEAQLREKLQRTMRQQRVSDEHHKQVLQQMQEESRRRDVQHEAELAKVRSQHALRIADACASSGKMHAGEGYVSNSKEIQSGVLSAKGNVEVKCDTLSFNNSKISCGDGVAQTPSLPSRPVVLTSPLMDSGAEDDVYVSEAGIDSTYNRTFNTCVNTRGAGQNCADEKSTVEIMLRSDRRSRSSQSPQGHTSQCASPPPLLWAETKAVRELLVEGFACVSPSGYGAQSNMQIPAAIVESDEDDN